MAFVGEPPVDCGLLAFPAWCGFMLTAVRRDGVAVRLGCRRGGRVVIESREDVNCIITHAPGTVPVLIVTALLCTQTRDQVSSFTVAPVAELLIVRISSRRVAKWIQHILNRVDMVGKLVPAARLVFLGGVVIVAFRTVGKESRAISAERGCCCVVVHGTGEIVLVNGMGNCRSVILLVGYIFCLGVDMATGTDAAVGGCRYKIRIDVVTCRWRSCAVLANGSFGRSNSGIYSQVSCTANRVAAVQIGTGNIVLYVTLQTGLVGVCRRSGRRIRYG